MVRLHASRDLYPVPLAGSPHHPGMPLDSTMRPAYAAVAESLGLGNAARYIQSPPTALLFAPMAFLPFRIAALWWRVLVTAAVLVTGSLVVVGTGPYTVFLREILPTLGRPYWDWFNQSIWSCLPRWIGEGHEPAWMRPAVLATAALLLIGVGAGLVRRPLAQRRQPETVFSAAAALIAWFLLFSPICWNSYQLYLMPFWGALLWSGLRSRAWFTLTVVLVGFGSVPWMTVYPHLSGGRPPELLVSSGFLANAGYFGVAAWWLWRGPRHVGSTEPAPPYGSPRKVTGWRGRPGASSARDRSHAPEVP